MAQDEGNGFLEQGDEELQLFDNGGVFGDVRTIQLDRHSSERTIQLDRHTSSSSASSSSAVAGAIRLTKQEKKRRRKRKALLRQKLAVDLGPVDGDRDDAGAGEDDSENEETFTGLLTALPADLQTLILSKTYGNSAIWAVAKSLKNEILPA